MPSLEGAYTLSIAVSAAAVVGGTAATYWYDHESPLLWRLPTGACTGLAAFGLVGFLLAMRYGLTTWVVALAAIIAASPIGLLLSTQYRHALWNDFSTAPGARLTDSLAQPRTIVRTVLFATGVVLLWRVAQRAMFVRPDGIYTGVSHNIGDLPFHLTVTNRFVYGRNFPPEHPSFAGVGFTYPFITDFIGSMFVQVGLPVQDVIVWSTFLLCLIIAAVLYRWTLDLTGRRDAATLAPALAFFSGGLGWWKLVGEIWRGDGSVWALLARLPHDYTITYDNEFRWGNLVTTLLVTQRALLLGLPLAVIVFHLWWRAMGASEHDVRARQSPMIAAGVIAGMLPLIHAHSFAVVIGVAACLAVLSADRWIWLPFFAWSFSLGIPQVWWVVQTGGVQSGTFVDWSFGWDRGDQNAFIFWLKNTGVLIPLIIVALFWRTRSPLVPQKLRLFYLPFVLCFVVPNLFRLAPWIWDNNKVLVYWFIASVPLVALVLARLAQGRVWRVALAATLFISLTLAGALDLWRVASGAFESRIFDREGIEFARAVVESTGPGSLILHAPIHNHPIALTGRRSLMGYPGHVWSHGLDPGPRQADIKRMYSGGSEAAGLLTRYRVDFVVLGPSERLPMQSNERFFERYGRAAEVGPYRLYRITGAQK